MSDYRNTPLWDNELPIEERLDYLLKELTLEEKIASIGTRCTEVERLGIKMSHMGGEAAHGIEARHDQAFNAGEPEPTTSFTQPIGMSGSFDRELIRECGRAVGEEARALFNRNCGKGGLCRWAPTVDMERDPRWGRTEEAYGEDPYLTGEMASAYIQGMKGEDPFYLQCGATLKHFYANNVEKDRIKISSSLDGRNKHEYYLQPFKRTITGGAEAVMTSYNEINGVPAIVNPEVQTLLKDSYGLPGHVVCDGGDFQQTVKDHQYFKTHAETVACGLKAGVDCFTDDIEAVMEAAREALAKGLITEEDLDRSLRNSFRTRIRLGFFDKKGDCPYTNMGEEYVNNEDHKELARKMAEASVVLLKNENKALPICEESTKSLAVVGPLADVWYKDWYSGVPPYAVTPLEGIQKQYPKAEVCCESGLSDIYLTCNGSYVGLDEEGRLYLTDQAHAEAFRFTDWGCGSTTLYSKSRAKFVTLEEGSYLIKADKKEAFGWFIRESWRFADKESGSEDMSCVGSCDLSQREFLVKSWNGRAVAVDEKGYLAVIKTAEKAVGEGDDGKLGRVSHALTEGEAAVFKIEIAYDGLKAAAEAAAKAEKAVVVIGSNPVINSKEEIDRTTLALPPAQQRLVDEVLSVNPNTVVVIVSNYPYSCTKLQKEAPAILFAPSGNQELGTGIAGVLSGRVSPSARLAMTWYLSDDDLGDMEDYDIIQSGHTYLYFDKDVLYPFGHGLSYSSFSYGPLTCGPLTGSSMTEGAMTEGSMTAGRNGGGFVLSCTVKNTGEVTADEVVQLYVHQEASRVKQPLRKLVGFEKVKALAPGEERTVVFRVPMEELAHYDVISKSMLVETSDYTFMAGASSQDIRQKIVVSVEGTKAPMRNLFAVTESDSYDESRGCFIHRGKGTGTCIIPGKAGEDPEFVDSTRQNPVSCELLYGNAVFDQIPRELSVTVCPLESGSIQVSFVNQEGKEGAVIDLAVKGNEPSGEFVYGAYRDGFHKVSASVPGGFAAASEEGSLRVKVVGKIKVAEFVFA